MEREIKFKYGYSDGINTFEKSFTLHEIEQGLHFEEISDSPLLRNYKIIYKRQYTGLKDKNDVEIYEGDILYHGLQGTRFVEYGSPFKNFGGYMLVSKNGMRGTLNDADRLYQVIGNIYENKDLLKG